MSCGPNCKCGGKRAATCGCKAGLGDGEIDTSARDAMRERHRGETSMYNYIAFALLVLGVGAVLLFGVPGN